MASRVYCIASAKGGSGKTMITASVANFLANVGKKCLIVDCDAATYGLTLLYIAEISSNVTENRSGLFQIIERQAGMIEEECLTPIEGSIVRLEGGVDFLPATYTFGSDLHEEKVLDINIFAHLMNTLRKKYDLIFLDAQAGSDSCSKLAMSRTISDEVVIVSEYDPMSAAGVERLKQTVGQDLDFSRTSILLNKMLPEFVDSFSEFLSVAKYLPPIPWNAEVVRAYAKRKLPLDLERGNVFTLTIMRTVRALMNDEEEIDIDGWAKEKAYALRAPLEDQYEAAEADLAVALKEKSQFERGRRWRALLGGYAVAVVCAVALVPLYFLPELFLRDINIMYVERAWVDGLVTVLAVMIAPVVLWVIYRFFWREKTLESSRRERIIATLEEKLKSLEALRAADYETIIKRQETFRSDV